SAGIGEALAVADEDHRAAVVLRHEPGRAADRAGRSGFALPVLDVFGLDAVFDEQVAVLLQPAAIAERTGPEVDLALPLGDVAAQHEAAGEAFLAGELAAFGEGQRVAAGGGDLAGKIGRLAQVGIEYRALEPVDAG